MPTELAAERDQEIEDGQEIVMNVEGVGTGIIGTGEMILEELLVGETTLLIQERPAVEQTAGIEEQRKMV